MLDFIQSLNKETRGITWLSSLEAVAFCLAHLQADWPDCSVSPPCCWRGLHCRWTLVWVQTRAEGILACTRSSEAAWVSAAASGAWLTLNSLIHILENNQICLQSLLGSPPTTATTQGLFISLSSLISFSLSLSSSLLSFSHLSRPTPPLPSHPIPPFI